MPHSLALLGPRPGTASRCCAAERGAASAQTEAAIHDRL